MCLSCQFSYDIKFSTDVHVQCRDMYWIKASTINSFCTCQSVFIFLPVYFQYENEPCSDGLGNISITQATNVCHYMYMHVIVQNENVNCTHISVHRVQDLWRPDVHLWRSWWRRCTRLLSKCGQHTVIKTNLTSGMCCAYTCTRRVSKLFIVFREIDDEETSDTDGDREEVEDGTVLPEKESGDDIWDPIAVHIHCM